MLLRSWVVGAALLLLAQARADPAGAQCSGDCDDSGSVSVDELVQGVAMALGRVAECGAMDSDADGGVSIDELLDAVHASLSDCVSTPPPTPCGDEAVMMRYAVCRGADTETECVMSGGTWTIFPFSRMEGCRCPTGQEDCLCTRPSDCVGRCFAPLDGGFDSCRLVDAGTCSTHEPEAGCWCEFVEDGQAYPFCNDP